ncbi:MAG: hypothetical protein IPJ55_01220 [Chloracidobacterium sp.]|nr:hypothetical protein [Chloracidobacterium sp.]MBK9436621.1 hypothetical protein [Chloracidobacterium sp.]MBL0241609.1 hypothetical protein [Chloracidobacterium sp.]
MNDHSTEVVPLIAASTRQAGSLTRSRSMNPNRELQYRNCDPDRYKLRRLSLPFLG